MASDREERSLFSLSLSPFTYFSRSSLSPIAIVIILIIVIISLSSQTAAGYYRSVALNKLDSLLERDPLPIVADDKISIYLNASRVYPVRFMSPLRDTAVTRGSVSGKPAVERESSSRLCKYRTRMQIGIGVGCADRASMLCSVTNPPILANYILVCGAGLLKID